MPTYDAQVAESAGFRVLRDMGGGFSEGAFSFGGFSAFGSYETVISSDLSTSNIDVSYQIREEADLRHSVFGFADQQFAFADGASGLDQMVGNAQTTSAFFDVASVSEMAFRTIDIPVDVFESARFRSYRDTRGGISSGAFADGGYSSLGDYESSYGGDTIYNLIDGSGRFSDTAGASQTNGIVLLIPRMVDETSKITESTRNTAELTFSIMPQSAVVFDLARSKFDALVDVIGSVGAVETLSVTPIYPGSIIESTTASETASTQVEWPVSFQSLAVGYEMLAPQVDYMIPMNEVVRATLVQINTAELNSAVREWAQITDPVQIRKQWENINTEVQSVDWRLIRTDIGS